MPLPPPEEQHEIVRRVEALFKLADSIEKHVSAATARVEKLTQASSPKPSAANSYPQKLSSPAEKAVTTNPPLSFLTVFAPNANEGRAAKRQLAYDELWRDHLGKLGKRCRSFDSIDSPELGKN